MTLKELKKGECAVVKTVGGKGALRQHFLDMGVIPGAYLKLTKFAPMGDPMELEIHGYSLTLRLADAAKIKVEKCTTKEFIQNEKYEGENEKEKIEHPGLGEDGKYHVKE